MVAAGSPPVPPSVPHELVQALARAVALRRVCWLVCKRVVHDPHTHAEYRPAREAAKNYKTDMRLLAALSVSSSTTTSQALEDCVPFYEI